MNLRLLAPDIQEELISLDRFIEGRDSRSRSLRQFQSTALDSEWRRHREQYKVLNTKL